MAPRIGILAEGVTDQAVLEAILAGWFGDDDLDVSRIQPPQAERAPAVGNAGWGMVIKSFETGRFAEPLASGLRDYLVVQIDTDVSEQKGFDVPWREGARERSVEELVVAVIARLRDAAGAERFDAHSDRMLFAICVHSLECWLLPLVYRDNKRRKTSGCLDAMNHALRAANKDALANAAGEKNLRAYERAARAFEDRNTLLDAGKHQPSLARFLRALEAAFPPPEGA